MVLRKRIIPVLLLHKGGLFKTKRFANPRYVGDPINAVRIFNEKEVDELIILDIDASKENRRPNLDLITDIVSEAFMPIAYGGGISSLEDAKNLFFNGIEKVVLNTGLLKNPGLVKEITSRYGQQSVIASIDVKKSILGKPKVYSHAKVKTPKYNIEEFAKYTADLGVGEIFLNVVDRDGTYGGYDLSILDEVTKSVTIPVIISGGASSAEDFLAADEAGASAMAAGSMFVFQRPHNAVLISYDI